MSWLHARDYPLDMMVNQIFSNEQDPLKGRQLPILFSAARLWASIRCRATSAAGLATAVGWAMASALRAR